MVMGNLFSVGVRVHIPLPELDLSFSSSILSAMRLM